MTNAEQEAMRALMETACHPRGSGPQRVDRRRKDADQFGYGPCDCGLDAALARCREVLGEGSSSSPENSR